MRNNFRRKFWQLLPLYLACYALWLGLSAIGIWLIFEVRFVLFNVALRLRFNPWQVRAVDQFGIVTLGLIWLVAILLLEDYLRKGVIKNRLWGRAARVFLFEAVALGIFYALQVLLT